MAFGILRTFLSRARSLGVLKALPDMSPILRQFQVQDNSYTQVEFEIPEEERPPMMEVPAYRKKFGLDP